jgi:Arabinose-binding domain of AraC transcription regulator, N-term
LRWSPPNWELRNLGGRACFQAQQTPFVLLAGRHAGAQQARCKGGCPRRAVLDWRRLDRCNGPLVAIGRAGFLIGDFLSASCYAVLKICSSMPKDDVLASIGQARGLPVMRNSDIRYTDTVPSAVGGITRFACEYAQERGIDVEALLQRSGLTAGQIEQPGVRLSVRSQIKFLELAARAFQDDFLGFHLAQKFELRAIGLLYYVLANAGRGVAARGALQHDRQ